MAKKKAKRAIKNDNFTVIWAAPILPGKAEAWRRFVQEMVGAQQAGYEDLCRRLNIQAVRVWITETGRGDVGVLAVIARHPQQIISHLAASNNPFDRWLRAQLADLQGVDLALPPAIPPSELLFDWRETTIKKGGKEKHRR